MSDLHEIYLRNKEGATYHPTDTRQGIADFLSEEGYRISFNIDGVVITLRRDSVVDEDRGYLDKQLNQDSVNCVATIHGHK